MDDFPPPTPAAAHHGDIGQAYRGYLTALNRRHWDELELYVHDEISFDGETMTRDEFVTRTESLIDAIPDFRWWADMLVVDGNRVFARLVDDGTPVTPWMGREVTGQPIHLVEYAMYRYIDGRIAAADLVIDHASIA